MNNYLILISVCLTFSSCTKSNINPRCWGDCKEATFFHAPCSAITGYLVIKDNPNDTLMITNSIPKKFRTAKIDVCVKVKEVEAPIITGNCNIRGVKYAKIKCIKKN
jgi:hypothetical protein